MYEGATLSVKINGHHYGPIPIRCAVLQVCPITIALYALYLHPFLRLLELKLLGISIGRRTRPTSVVTYVDDVNIFVTSAADFTIIEEAIHLHEQASGSRFNQRKSKTLAVGSFCTQGVIFGIAYHPSETILGITFWGTIEQTMKTPGRAERLRCERKQSEPTLGALAWQPACVMSTPFSCPKSGIPRKSCRPEHIHPTNDSSQCLVHLERSSLPSACIDTTTTKTNERMGMTDIVSKCKALLLFRMYLQGIRGGTTTAGWLQT